MRTLHVVLAGLTLILGSSSAGAQTFEAGGSIASSCKGSDGSFCSDTHNGLRTAGPYASVWFWDFVEVGGRVVWLTQPDLYGSSSLAIPIEYSITDRQRTVMQAEVTWHFREGKRVRPMFGLGVGAYRDTELVTCGPTGCETQLPRTGLTAGESVEWHRDISLMTGVSALVHPRIRIRGGWRYHNPLRDELALSELFLSAGVRF